MFLSDRHWKAIRTRFTVAEKYELNENIVALSNDTLGVILSENGIRPELYAKLRKALGLKPVTLESTPGNPGDIKG
jgi:hypothetical protein